MKTVATLIVIMCLVGCKDNNPAPLMTQLTEECPIGGTVTTSIVYTSWNKGVTVSCQYVKGKKE